VGAAAPLQEAGAMAMALPESYYAQLAKDYQGRRDLLLAGLREAGFLSFTPRGAYYIMADISNLSSENDMSFTNYLVKEVGIAVVPGSSFFHEPGTGSRYIRFCFCKQDSTLRAATERLKRISGRKFTHSG
jgi:aminotransferase